MTPKNETEVKPLTLKEKNVLQFLESYLLENAISPTYQEICDHFGFASYNSVQRYLKQLEAKNYIKLPWGNQKRAITLLHSSSAMQEALVDMQRDTSPTPVELRPEAVSLPLLGRVAAGQPLEAFEHDEFIDVPTSMVKKAEQTFALRVQGQSMIEDGILDGDVILVQEQKTARNGEIIVAVVENEATVKRFYMQQNKEKSDSNVHALGGNKMIELRPANSSMESLWYHPSEVQIRGVVVSLIRQF
jgi:repressor LexA